jgi:hypothetical protein
MSMSLEFSISLDSRKAVLPRAACPLAWGAKQASAAVHAPIAVLRDIGLPEMNRLGSI